MLYSVILNDHFTSTITTAESISENLSNETGERNSIPPSMGNFPSGLARMELPCEVPGNNHARNLPEEIRNSIGSGSPSDIFLYYIIYSENYLTEISK